jgi:hypothetical protein
MHVVSDSVSNNEKLRRVLCIDVVQYIYWKSFYWKAMALS